MVDNEKQCLFYYSPKRYPAIIPTIPPTAERSIEENEKGDAPQSDGMNPPTVDPIKSPIYTSDFVFIRYYSKVSVSL